MKKTIGEAMMKATLPVLLLTQLTDPHFRHRVAKKTMECLPCHLSTTEQSQDETTTLRNRSAVGFPHCL